MKKLSIALGALGVTLACAAAAHDGAYVDTFGDQGREQLMFSPSLFVGSGFVGFVDLAVQPDDDKIIVATSVLNTSSQDFGVMRLNPNGTLDTNFGTQGQTIIPFDNGGSNLDIASSVMLQPNGRIVLCGQASGDDALGGNDFGVARVLANGTPDTQFSGDGKATIAFDLGPSGARNDFAVRCSLQGDGKILAAGQAQTDTASARMAVARLNTDGSRDTAFNGSGTATVDFGPSYTQSLAFSVKSLPDDSTLLIGQATGASSIKWAFAKLDADGQLDTSFGNGGIVLFDPGIPTYQAVEALDAAVLPDDSFVVVGGLALLPGATNVDYGIYKFNANGSLDTSFGSDGGQIVAFDLGGTFIDIGVKILEDANGRFLTVGISNSAPVPFASSLVRLTADGQLDSSFGVGGKLTVSSAAPSATDFGDEGTSIAFDSSGNILVGSIALDASSNLLAGVSKIVGDTLFDDGFDGE